jgi:Flp pilus assembly protein TadG
MLDRIRQALRNERGSILLFVTVGIVVLLGMAGLALDSGWAYIRKAQLSRAVDAGVLAAARSLRSGRAVAEQQAIAVAAANGITLGEGGISYGIQFGSNARGEQTVSMFARRPVPTLLMRVLGFKSVGVRSVAVAAVKPVDLVLVLDQSGSLRQEDCSNAAPGVTAWTCLVDASKSFVDQFHNGIDQMGLVSFQLRAGHRFHLSHGFKAPIKNDIDDMKPVGDTNAGDGLRLALEQLQSEAVRDHTVKVVVFFTDGRPTAFRGQIDGQDRVMAVYRTPSAGKMRGRWDNPPTIPMDEPSRNADDCENYPQTRPCLGWTEPMIREQSRVSAEVMAAQIRSRGVVVYSVGLGNPTAENPLFTPDMAHLERVANEDGVVDPDQPRGRAYFAESGEQLQQVFRRLAQDLTIRLAR